MRHPVGGAGDAAAAVHSAGGAHALGREAVYRARLWTHRATH